MFCGALAILLDFFVEASCELVSVQAPEAYAASPPKTGKDLFQFGGTGHRRFKLAVFAFVLDKPPGKYLQEPCRPGINASMAGRFPAQITQEGLEPAIRFERSGLKLLIPGLERKAGLAVVQISQDAAICILKYSGIGKDELPVNVFN